MKPTSKSGRKIKPITIEVGGLLNYLNHRHGIQPVLTGDKIHWQGNRTVLEDAEWKKLLDDTEVFIRQHLATHRESVPQ
jgi:hypothetical protein